MRNTYFEQIPLTQVVKRVIPEKDPKMRESILDNLMREPASKKTEPYSIRADSTGTEWRREL